MAEYGKKTRHTDPFLHFYETFLHAYDAGRRKERGVYYTPEPVVEFIVRAVDDILRGEFGLQNGIANGGKTVVEVEEKGKKKKQEVHKVQILDPATGTGTFLAAIIRHIRSHYFQGQEGAWRDYARKDLIPRLNGFEVLIAPYAMAHIKLQMVLSQTDPELGDERTRIFLTNTLEKSEEPDKSVLGFTNWLANEARNADTVKRNRPVMVVIGNPPYHGESQNKGEWICDLLKSYKKEPGGVERLDESNSKWLNDDYCKFIRYGQHHIDRTGKGILAYITNHRFIENLTFRGMRWNLLQSFDKIYIVDLHGGEHETAPDGSPDVNVFDIRQGVSINLFIKTGKKKAGTLARVFHYDEFGSRAKKFQFLSEKNLEKVQFEEISPRGRDFFFAPKDYALLSEYEKGFFVSDLFLENSVGIVTARDDFTIHRTAEGLEKTISEFRALSDDAARTKFSLGADAREWKVALARKDLENCVFGNGNDAPVPICYRPFDVRYTYYTGNSKGFHCRPRDEVMRHFRAGENVGLVFKRGGIEEKSPPVFMVKHISESRSWSRSGMQGIETSAPLYIYPANVQEDLDGKIAREPNLDPEIVNTVAGAINMCFTREKESNNKTFAPIDLLDYIYAVLHAPSYRERYNEFLKIDFPRVPYPQSAAQFRKLAKLGGKLRALHLMEPEPKLITTYSIRGDNTVDARALRRNPYKYKTADAKKRLGNVHINAEQYFENVPEIAWNLYIGGYQPAQRYLRDRKDSRLSPHEIDQYQKIIAALAGTAKLLPEIDAAWVAPKNP
ncbi:MAG: N-6 DNA methylase [Gammaproteobacteria bacterium]|nr:N-6 DNA methylase [Gammaproteobacteria bacterium]